MNSLFIPNESEEKLIESIQVYNRNEFELIRLTSNMLTKSIIDANKSLRNLLSNANIVDFKDVDQTTKIYNNSILISEEVYERKTSYYRPKTKNGDPRFWVYGLSSFVKPETLLYITTFENKLVLIALEESDDFIKKISDFFGTVKEEDIIYELIEKLKAISALGWIESSSPLKSNPKDVGETLENKFGISSNSLKTPDYEGQIELKSKRLKAGTNDSLFSKVPDWSISRTKSSADMILGYGYESKVHSGFYDLYVTVSNQPNRQGLFNLADLDQRLLHQYYANNGSPFDVCSWTFDLLKETLQTKHPKTAWIDAEQKLIDGKIHFHYKALKITQRPIFSQFISLINQGIITFDWRGKVKPDKTGYKDHGHGFRIKPSNRSKLFGSTIMHKISN